MKNPLSFLSHKNLEASLGTLQKRFPIPTIIALVIAGFFFFMIHRETASLMQTRIVITLVVTFFCTTSVTLFRESEKKPQTIIWSTIALLYAGIFFVSLRHISENFILDTIVFSSLHLVGFISLLFFAPYLKNLFYKTEQGIEYTNYFTRISWTFLMSAIVGGSLMALGSIAIASISALFDLSDIVQKYHIFENWSIVTFALITPLYGLLHIPRVQEIEKKNYDINRFFSFLIRFIATPFIVIYFIILYAYSVKVLMNFQDWPKGMISWMVVGFSTFGYLTYIFSKPYEVGNKIIFLFRKFFPYAVPAQIVMLSYAIYLRIAQYDLTMNRYFVVIFGVWLAIISLYYIVSQRKSLTCITASLALISLIISVGPWSVSTLPMNRQYNRLVHNLESAGMLKDGVIAKKKTELTVTQENDIYSGIQYVCDYDRCEKIKSLFRAQLVGKEEASQKTWNTYNYKDKEYPGMTSWEIVSAITNDLGISYRYNEGMDIKNQKYISLHTINNFPDGIFPLDIKGYERILRIYNSEYAAPQGSEYVSINAETESLSLFIDGEKKGTVSLKAFNDNLSAKYTHDSSNLPQSDLSYTVFLNNTEIKILLDSYSLRNKNSDSSEILSFYAGISGYALIKQK